MTPWVTGVISAADFAVVALQFGHGGDAVGDDSMLHRVVLE